MFEGHAAGVGDDARLAVGEAAWSHLGDAALPTRGLGGTPKGMPGLIPDDTRRAVQAGSHEGIAGRRHWRRVARPARPPHDLPIMISRMISSLVPSRLMTGIALRVVR